MKTKIFYHIIEDCQNGDLGHQGICNTLKEAEETVSFLENRFENSYFWVFTSADESEPPFITI